MDFIVRKADHAPVFLELNTLPGFTSHSLVPRAAAVAGFSGLDVLRAVLVDVRGGGVIRVVGGRRAGPHMGNLSCPRSRRRRASSWAARSCAARTPWRSSSCAGPTCSSTSRSPSSSRELGPGRGRARASARSSGRAG
jgi:hypothetical protein